MIAVLEPSMKCPREFCTGSMVWVDSVSPHDGIVRDLECFACGRPLERPATPVEDGLLYEDKQRRRRPRIGGQLL